MIDIKKEVFLKTWPGGYSENWEVYGNMTKTITGKLITEQEVVDKCLIPFYNKEHTCLEIGCGKAFWTDRYLAENFKRVIAIDILPVEDFKKVKVEHDNIEYIELPDRSFDCGDVADNSIDFVWSFGVFCHLTLEANQKYLYSIYDKCKVGAKVVLYYSNNDRRPHYAKDQVMTVDPNQPLWCKNDLETTILMLENAGFTNIYDIMPELPDTMICATKPKRV